MREPLYTVGQALGILVMAGSFFTYTVKERKRVFIFKLIADGLSVIQNVLIGALTGAAICFVNVGRDVVFMNRENCKWAQSAVWLGVFLLATCISPVLTWAGWISLIPMTGSVFVAFGLYSLNAKTTRVLGIIGTAFWTAYSLLTWNIGATLSTAFAVVAGTVALLREGVKEKKEKIEQDGQ